MTHFLKILSFTVIASALLCHAPFALAAQQINTINDSLLQPLPSDVMPDISHSVNYQREDAPQNSQDNQNSFTSKYFTSILPNLFNKENGSGAVNYLSLVIIFVVVALLFILFLVILKKRK